MNKLPQTTLCLLIKDTQILLAMKKRGFGNGKWNGVGGKLEPGEVLLKGLIREAKEEIGVILTKTTEVGRLQFFFTYNPSWNQEVVLYTATEWIGEPSESEEMKPQWFENNSLPYALMWPDDTFWLPEVLRGKYVTGSFTFDGNGLITKQNLDAV